MKQLRKNIEKELAKVTDVNAPNIFRTIQTESGYASIEDRIINMMIDHSFSASACIMQIEMTL